MSFINDIKKSVETITGVVKRTYGPLAALEAAGTMNTEIWRYPLDVGDSNLYPHTIEFQAWKPRTVPLKEGVDIVKDKIAEVNIGGAVKNAVGALDKRLGGILPGGEKPFWEKNNKVEEVKNNPTDYKPIFDFQRFPNQDSIGSMDMTVNRTQKYNSRLFDFNRDAEKSDLFVLYIPEMIQETNTNQYEQASMTDALGLAGAIGDAVKTAGASSTEDAKDGFWNQMTPYIGEALFNKIGKKLQDKGIVGDAATLRTAGLQSMGWATNPQYEVLYRGTDMRRFQFDFKLTPRSQREATEIKNIIRWLKYHSSPEYKPDVGRFLIPPSYFDISFKFNNRLNRNLFKISTCVLEGIDVSYATTGQFATYEDGMPIEIALVLRFIELEAMHKALRAKGY
jgi:hypothetical protein